jgi:CheY-like chemotaxis protein
MRRRILIVDDDPRFRALARALLHAAGHAVVAEAADGAQALAALRRERPDAALVDVQLPETNGLELARALAASDNNLRIILTSADPTLVPPAALKESRALAFVPKDELAITDLAPLLRSPARR